MENRDILSFKQSFNSIENEVSSVIIGQSDIIRLTLAAVIAGGNVLLEGMPGLGKTQLVKAFASVMDLNFSRIQFTPDIMPADVTGTNIVVRSEEGNSFEFRRGPVFSNIVLADEINRATPKTQSALLEAMQEKTVTSGGKTYRLEEPFFVLATQNPIEQEGTYPLPEAQLDRFLFKLNVGYPTKEELLKIVTLTTGLSAPNAKKITGGAEIMKMREAAASVPVASAVMDYVMDLIVKTHPDTEAAPNAVKKYVRLGASPRGAQAIITASRIFALAAGRFNVSYDDVKAVAPAALRHRLLLNFEAITDGVSSDNIIEQLIDGEL